MGCKRTKEDKLPDIREGYVAVEGGKIWYRISGADKEGIPLLVVHGGPGAPHYYLSSLEDLSDARPVILYDQLGCGKSERPSDTALWTVARYTRELDTLVNTLKLKQFHLLGQSWGGYLATAYTLAHPERKIQSLTLTAPLLSTALWLSDQEYWISELPQAMQDTIRDCEARGDFASPGYQEAMMEFYRRHLCRMDPWPDCLYQTMEELGPEVYNYMWGPSEFTVTGTLKDADLRGQLALISIPCLITCGLYDEARPETMAVFQGLIPEARLEVFTQSAHQHHLEEADAYQSVLRDFLKASEE
jgi:proline iminopeptidase